MNQETNGRNNAALWVLRGPHYITTVNASKTIANAASTCARWAAL